MYMFLTTSLPIMVHNQIFGCDEKSIKFQLINHEHFREILELHFFII